MENKSVKEIFDKGSGEAYDERNAKMRPILENLHFLIGLVLRDLPVNAKILCVGAGTGLEIVALAKANPGWTFRAVEPSAPMLKACRERVAREGLSDRCELFQGYLSEYHSAEQTDAVLCLLVMHFVKDQAERQKMFDDMARRLKPGGYLINAEISYDVGSSSFPQMLQKWKALHATAGATQESLDNMLKMFEEFLAILPPAASEELFRKAGLTQPLQFFQSLMIRAWFAQKTK